MAAQYSSVKVVIDPFCGAGIIQLAKLCDKVIAVDIDPKKILLTKYNAFIYGVYHKIDFIVGDFFKLGHAIKGDVLVTSPPYGVDRAIIRPPLWSRRRCYWIKSWRWEQQWPQSCFCIFLRT